MNKIKQISIFLFGFVLIACKSGGEIPEKYKYLYEGGYTDSLIAAEEIIQDGNAAIGQIERILSNTNIRPPEGSMYPFNIFWALSRIGGRKAENLIQKYHALDEKEAGRALRAIKIKEKYSTKTNAGVFWQADQNLYENPNQSSKIIGMVRRNDEILIRSKQRNPEEIGPRGQEQLYLYIEVVGSTNKGYLPVLGFDFDPFY
jgi:hypothetical protein